MSNLLPAPVSPLLRDAQGVWGRLSSAQKLTLAGVAAVVVLVLGVFANMARTPEYAVAFSGLRDDDAAAIVAKLKESKTPYQLEDRGTIKVPPAQVQEVRLQMAAQGLPQKGSNVGMELFNQPHLGVTEFAEKVNYQRALEGELSRTIGRLDAVDSARVHLVVPQPALFASQQKDATASVVLQLKPGRRLAPDQVQGITALVASSVEGLKPENVTVMDAAGVTLSDGRGGADGSRQMGSRADVQRSLEQRLENDIRAMLVRVAGPDRAIVRVSADLNWDQYEANTETYSPEAKAPQVRTERKITETQSSSNGQAGGVPGADSNIPTYAGTTAGANGNAQSQRQDTTTTYELSKTVEKLVRAPGGIRRLSVAVALDSDVVNDVDQADAISKLVATAAGLDTQRGDVVTLTSLPFSSANDRRVGESPDDARMREFVVTVARLLAMALGPLLVSLLLWRVLKRDKRTAAGPVISVAPLSRDEAHALEAGHTAELPLGEQRRRLQGGPAAVPQISEEEREQIRMQEELTQMAKSEPVAVAQLVRTWLQEDRK
ncbi:MAG TPA: flagellar basal-body MS-ring/collar protein FliF [Chloroflexota bacterium]|nr:flagellar basal-body MS-ring/collar protein FliF [Chloroflexota bacterium]